MLTGITKVTMFDISDEYQQVTWANRRWSVVADAVMGPMGLRDRVVRFVIHPPASGEKTIALPWVAPNKRIANWLPSEASITMDDGVRLYIGFDPD